MRLGITFSGGGARGIAHIGAIRAFREAGIEFDSVAGTSAGAIVGAMYAAGLSNEEMRAFVEEASLFKAVKVGLPLDGLASLSYLSKRLTAFLPGKTFEELQKPLFLAVTNLITGEAEIICEGPLIPAITASSSIPLIFKPVEMGGQLYVDGGVILNMPVDPLLPHADFIIGVNVRPRVPIARKEVQNVVGIAQRCFDLSLQGNIRPSVQLCDFVVEPRQLHRFGLFQFNKWEELIQIGYDSVIDRLDDLQERMEEVGTLLTGSKDLPVDRDW